MALSVKYKRKIIVDDKELRNVKAVTVHVTPGNLDQVEITQYFEEFRFDEEGNLHIRTTTEPK